MRSWRRRSVAIGILASLLLLAAWALRPAAHDDVLPMRVWVRPAEAEDAAGRFAVGLIHFGPSETERTELRSAPADEEGQFIYVFCRDEPDGPVQWVLMHLRQTYRVRPDHALYERLEPGSDSAKWWTYEKHTQYGTGGMPTWSRDGLPPR